jgi:pimeloyl-ACP methyl ester carboxylesterase
MSRVPIVFVPGLLCDARLWRVQAEALATEADCWVADATRSGTMAGLARDLLEDCPFDRFALGGLSMGGYVALEVLQQAPARVTRLALLDTSARADTSEQSRKRRDFIELAGRGRFLGVTDALLPVLIHPSRIGDAELVTVVKSMAKNIGKEAFVRQEQAIMSRADSRPLLPLIACPTLVLCGRQDALTPLALHEELAAAIPGARLDVIEDCGHLSTLERPAQVAAALRRWLSFAT